MLSINFNTSKTDNYLCRLRTATALNLCEIQVIQINHDSIWEIFLVVQKMVYHILGVKVKNIYTFPWEKSDRIFLRHSQLQKNWADQADFPEWETFSEKRTIT